MKRDWGIITAVVALVVVILVTILLLTFQPSTDAEIENAWELYSKDWSSQFGAEDFRIYMHISTDEKQAIDKATADGATRDYGPAPTELKLSTTRFTDREIKLNQLVYNIVKQNMTSPEMKGIPEILRDPLFVLAQSNAEHGGLRGASGKLLAPAAPAAQLGESLVTELDIKTWNTAKSIRLSNQFWGECLQAKPTGPLQMQAGYGSLNLPKSLLVYQFNEYKVVAADPIATGLAEKITKKVNPPSLSPYGDRWNWNDASVMTMNSWSINHKAMRGGDKKLSILRDRYAVAAYLALLHNVGSSISASQLTTTSEGFLKSTKGDGATILDAWNFIEWISQPIVVADIKKLAIEKLNNNSLTYRPKTSDMDMLIQKYGAIMNKETFVTMSKVTGQTSEPPMHALTMLYNYIMLEELANGR